MHWKNLEILRVKLFFPADVFGRYFEIKFCQIIFVRKVIACEVFHGNLFVACYWQKADKPYF